MVEMKYPMISNETVAHNLKHLRKASGLKLSDIMDFLGLERTATIYEWESGKYIPGIDNLYALSRLYNTTVDSIISSDDAVHFYTVMPYIFLSADLLEYKYKINKEYVSWILLKS